jgi:hypothetical protein
MCWGMIVSGATETKIKSISDNIDAQYTSNISVPVKLSSNQGLLCFGFEIEYDDEYLEPISVEQGTIITSGIFSDSIGTKYSNPFRVTWNDTTALSGTGNIFNLNFKANKSGETIIRISSMKDDTCDSDYNKVSIETIEIKVNITCEHLYTEKIDTEATCTVKGIKTYICSICGDSYQEYIEKIAHDYNEVITRATCTEDGRKVYTCKNCGYGYDEKIEKIAHDYDVVTISATCTEDGRKVYACKNCGYGYDEKIEKIAHDYDVVTMSATCTEDGKKVYTCKSCGYGYDEKIKKIAHDYDVVTISATCTEDGKKVYTCKNCGYSYDEILDKLGHNYKSVVTAPTCVAKGYTTHTCTKCDNLYVDSYVDIIEHTPIVDSKVEPTCISTGLTEGNHCSVCGKILVVQSIIDKISHTYKKQTVTPTCTNKGYDQYTCIICGDEYVENYVTATGHTIVKDVYKAQTCKVSGLTEGSHCSVCNLVIVEQQVIPMVEHVYNEIVTQPTCTVKGYTMHTCQYCGEAYKDNWVDATGHNYVLIERQEATTSAAGKEVYKCFKCNDSYVTELSQLETKDNLTEKPIEAEKTTGNAKTSQKVTTTKQTSTSPSKTTVAKKTQKITNIKIKKYKVKNLKKKKIIFNLRAKTSGNGKLTYKVYTCSPKKISKYIQVSKKGKVTIKKGAKKGKYKILVNASATSKYKACKKVITIQVK